MNHVHADRDVTRPANKRSDYKAIKSALEVEPARDDRAWALPAPACGMVLDDLVPRPPSTSSPPTRGARPVYVVFSNR